MTYPTHSQQGCHRQAQPDEPRPRILATALGMLLALAATAVTTPATAEDTLLRPDLQQALRLELPLEQARLADESSDKDEWLPGLLVINVGIPDRRALAWMVYQDHWRDVELSSSDWQAPRLLLTGSIDCYEDAAYQLRCEIEVTGDQARGQVQLTYHRPSKDRTFQSEAQTTGRVLTTAALRQREALADDAAWPGWRGGPQSGVAAGITDNDLIDGMGETRFVWASADRLPMPGHTDWQALSGYGELTIADNKVFVNYYRGSGEHFPEGKDLAGMRAEHHGKRDKWQRNAQAYIDSHYGGDLDHYLREKWSILADDIVDCYDATSGRLLWRATFPAQGLNWHNCDGPHFNPAYADGRLYVVGSAGMLYALDATSGATLWQRPHPGFEPEAWQQRCLTESANGNPVKHCGADMVGKPMAADGVVVVADRHLYGIDAETGATRWGPIEEVSQGNPRLWRHDGTAYVLCRLTYKLSDGAGIACVELQSGRVCWIDRRFVGKGEEFAHNDTYLFSPGLPNAVPGQGKENKALRDGYRSEAVLEPTCYQLSPQGLKRVWSLPLRGFVRNGTKMCAPVIHDGHLYALLEAQREGSDEYERLLVCVELASGTVVGKEVCGGSKSWTSLIAGDGRIMMHNFSTGLVQYYATAPDFRTLEFRQWKPPGTFQLLTWRLVDGRLFMREKEYSRIYCYDLRVP